MPQKIRVAASVAACIVLAFALNPSPQRHRAKIREAIAERSPLADVLGIGAVTAFVSEYHSIGVASYTEAGDRMITLGAFGIVFVAPSTPFR